MPQSWRASLTQQLPTRRKPNKFDFWVINGHSGEYSRGKVQNVSVDSTAVDSRMDDRSSRKPPGPRVGRIRRLRSPITLVAAGLGGLQFSYWGWDSVALGGVRIPSLNVVRPPVQTLDAAGAAYSVQPAPLRSRFGNYFSNTLKGLWLPGRPPLLEVGQVGPHHRPSPAYCYSRRPGQPTYPFQSFCTRP